MIRHGKFDPSKKKKKKKEKKQIGLIASFDIDITENNAPHGHNFEPDYCYEELLSRVFGKLREEDLEVSIEKKPRTVMMPPQLLAEGTQRTICLNFADLCRTMHRKPDHVMRFLLSQMETTKGFLNKQQKLEMNGLVSSKDFQAVFRRYIDTFVICSCCKSPDTDIAEEDNGLLTLRCEMCGLVASIKEPIYKVPLALADFDSESEEEWEMVQKKGTQFTLNGQPFYVNGFNTYWMMTLAADNSTRGKVTEVFQQASAVGMTVGRTWAFNDGQWRALQKSPSVYDEEVFKALDFVVSEARKYNIRLILSLVNNWNDYGGKAQYVKWGNASGLNLTSDDDFFSNPTLRDYYKSHVRTVLNRVNTFTNITYKNDPTIFSWELMNEPRCPSDQSGDKLQSWIQEMAVFVKSLDAKHLVEIGLEGFYGPSAPARTKFNPNPYATQVGTDFIRNNQALGVDFATVHVYPDSWISPAVSDSFLEFTSSWMQAHVDDAETYLGMPVLFTEFGVSAHDTGFNTSFRDKMLDTVYKMTLNSTRKGGAGAGSLVWQVFPQGAEFMDDGYALYLTRAHTASKIITLQSKRLAMFNSLCGWRCKWSCKKKNHTALDAFLSHDEL